MAARPFVSRDRSTRPPWNPGAGPTPERARASHLPGLPGQPGWREDCRHGAPPATAIVAIFGKDYTDADVNLAQAGLMNMGFDWTFRSPVLRRSCQSHWLPTQTRRGSWKWRASSRASSTWTPSGSVTRVGTKILRAAPWSALGLRTIWRLTASAVSRPQGICDSVLSNPDYVIDAQSTKRTSEGRSAKTEHSPVGGHQVVAVVCLRAS